MKALERVDPYTWVIVVCAAVSAVTAGVAGLAIAPYLFWVCLVGASAPWFRLWTLRPRWLGAERLGRRAAVAVAVAALFGLAGLVWLAAFAYEMVNSGDGGFLLIALLAILAVAIMGSTSATKVSLPATLLAPLLAGGVVLLAAMGIWASMCPGCGVHPYHDPPTRAFMLGVYASMGSVALSGLAGGVVVFAYGTRLLSHSRVG